MRPRFIIFAILVLFPQEHPAASEIAVDQGSRWTDADRKAFYKADQGSRMMRYEWLAALKQKDGTPFLADRLARYGYLKDPDDQDDLPIGFTRSGTLGSQTVGMTCSACHTRQLSLGSNTYRIDGGPALVDFQAFLEDIDSAVADTLATDAKFKAFADVVFGNAPANANDIAVLKQEVADWYLRYHTIMDRSLPKEPKRRWGLGRLDAVAMIFNRVTGLDIGPPPNFIIADNIKPADAPARYPFLWNAPIQNKTQWAGFAENGSDLLALSRNVGQVLGVFAVFQPKKEGSFVNFLNRSSVNFDGLARLERLVKKIGPPKWPWAIDGALAAAGEAVYKNSCGSCHAITPVPLRSTWDTPLQNVGTDTRQHDILGRVAKSGAIEGAFIPFATKPLKERDQALNILITSVIGSIAENILGVGGGSPSSRSQARTAAAGVAPAELAPTTRLPPELRDLEHAFTAQDAPIARMGGPAAAAALSIERGAYEARVLEGIWAAAPYLHNGSVPTLAQLLLPPPQRLKTFKVGPEYDLAEVGLSASQPQTSHEIETTDCDDLNSGNSRCGHDFGTHLSTFNKKALLEYLKKL